MNSPFIQLVSVLVHCILASSYPSGSNITTDQSALRALKNHILSDPKGVLENWTDSSLVCSWSGVTCGTRHRRVIAVNIYNMGITGSIPPEIGNLSFLVAIDIRRNNFGGTLPNELVRLRRLKFLRLSRNNFFGPIPLSIFNMSTLEDISFFNNSLSGTLPNDVCFGLPMLRVLDLEHNLLSGEIPSNLSSCPKLELLSLAYNIALEGTIPREIGRIKMLVELYLGGNKLTGPIPPEIGKLQNLQILYLEYNLLTRSLPLTIFNMSSLQVLMLQHNKLSGSVADDFGNLTTLQKFFLGDNRFTGMIPRVFNKLTQLEILDLGMNRLSGPIPSYIFNLTTLRAIQLSANDFSGSLPTNLGIFLPHLERLYLAANSLNGVLPNSISNSSLLKILDLPDNKLHGPIPNSLGNLEFLEILNLGWNNFTSEPGWFELSFIISLISCRHLRYLRFSENPLNGILPTSIGNFSSSLQIVRAARCKIKGHIPNEIGNLSALVSLYLDENYLTGVFPSALNKLPILQELILGNNQLIGFIPDDLCKFKTLGAISLRRNQLTGSIPSCMGNVSSLRYIYLNSNNLTSGIPSSIWSLHDLLELDISSNSITGSLSSQIGNLKAALSINLSVNQLSNDIPNTFESLQKVTVLSLAHNRFQGAIPYSLGKMLSLASLDLSQNMLSGTIPKSLESLLQLSHFNVSFNELYGQIPTNGPFRNFTSQSFAFNTALCGPPRFQVSPCKESPDRSKKKVAFRTVFIVPVIGAIMFIGIMAFLVIRYRRNKKSPTEPDVPNRVKPQRMSYYELLKATNGCSEGNLLGKGGFGFVYKGVLEDGTILAIKVFNMLLDVASKTFDVECDALRNLRHRNLIKVIGSCSNQDFKAIVLEYMPNGSLEKWLYSGNHFLDFMQRLNMMIDVANALEYLHHGFPTPVVHCDLKPSNVLLDENMVAHLSDFGMTKFLGEESQILTRTIATLGYMAPEYGMEGRVSTRCDVYSYGIMLLETFTQKRPSDGMFSGDMNIKYWVKDSLPDALSQVLDPSLMDPGEMNLNENLSCACSLMEIAIRCCADSPSERLNIKDVVAELKKIKAKFMLHHPGISKIE